MGHYVNQAMINKGIMGHYGNETKSNNHFIPLIGYVVSFPTSSFGAYQTASCFPERNSHDN